MAYNSHFRMSLPLPDVDVEAAMSTITELRKLT